MSQVGSQAPNQATPSQAANPAHAGEGMLGGASAAGRNEFISFAIGDEQYGVNIMAVREIKEWSNVTHLPKQPDYVRGVLNLRGVMVPIVDLRCRFGEGITESTPMHIVIIVQIEGRQVGLLADRVLDIVSFETSKIQAVPEVAADARASFLSGLISIEGAMLALVDLPNLLTSESDGAISAITEPKFSIEEKTN
jgi:purine-binding chemotaxis protein CheW